MFCHNQTLPHRPVAPPSPALSLRERVSSNLKRFIVPGNKSPDTPNKKEVQQINSRPGTPNSDCSSKLPSFAMERIKIQTNNAKDRMEIMQKRYHDYQDSLKTGGSSDSNRASMNASPFEVCHFSLSLGNFVFFFSLQFVTKTVFFGTEDKNFVLC